MPDALADYRERRDFRRTPEPSGDDADPQRTSDDSDMAQSDAPIFVIQQHAASSMHWDFRIEADGVLKSWAVPKGPSTDPSEKRLAVRTEDHPMDYADFEGTIPEDEYGGGEVIVWDRGTYENLTTDDDGDEVPIEDALDDGTVEIELHGEKLQGAYVLVHTKMRGDEKNWLLIKKDDDAADARRNPTSTEPESVISGKTVEDV